MAIGIAGLPSFGIQVTQSFQRVEFYTGEEKVVQTLLDYGAGINAYGMTFRLHDELLEYFLQAASNNPIWAIPGQRGYLQRHYLVWVCI